MRDEARREIQRRIEAFYHGEPQSIEVEIDEGVWFVADNPFEEDLMEPSLTAGVLIEGGSPHHLGEPTIHATLSRYSEVGDELMADVVSQAVHDAGGEFGELVFEYSPHNSGNGSGMLVFLGSVPNERSVFNPETGEVEVNEVYA